MTAMGNTTISRFWPWNSTSAQLNNLTKLVIELKGILMTDLAALTAQVKANTDVVKSAQVLIAGLAAKITEAGTDPAKLADLVATLKQTDDDLAAAVAANTPAAPKPPAA